MATITPIVPYRHGRMPDHRRFPADTMFVDDEGKGKKYALLKGVSAASTDYVWLMDDDVTIPDSAMSPLSDSTDADLIILPLIMSEGDKSLLSRLQQTEYAAIQTLTLLSAERGKPIMCSGANMIVKRQCWLESAEDLHYDIPSGDDMFLLESFKRRKLKITARCEPCLLIEPQSNIRDLLCQRMRWAGKSPHYTDRDIIACGVAVLLINLFSLLIPPLWLLKFCLELSLLSYGRKNYNLSPHTSVFVALLLSLIYPIYILISLFGGLFSRKW